MKFWYRPTFILSVLIHAALFAALDPFRVDGIDSSVSSAGTSTIDVELVMSAKPTRTSVRAPKVLRTVTRERDADVVVAVEEPAIPPATSGGSVSPARSSSEGSTESSSGTSSANLTPEQLYLADVSRMLESKKNYPMAARRLGHQGRVIVRFVVGRDGQILEAKITKGSTSDILNRAARSLIENIGGLKPFPTEIRFAEWAVVVPIEYQM